jgi:cytidylate kinase
MSPNSEKITIAIDGFSSCGKSTLARQLAADLGYIYIDSGAMYRAITLHFLQYQVDWKDALQVQHALESLELCFAKNPDTQKMEINLNGEFVEASIREMQVAEQVSAVAAIKAVRTFAVQQQKRLGAQKGIVMDGRDIGTVVFPHAELKIFMTADPEIRAKRRYEELRSQGKSVRLEEVQENLALRDHIDSTRAESPLMQASDAIVLDNSYLTIEEQLDLVKSWVVEKK